MDQEQLTRLLQDLVRTPSVNPQGDPGTAAQNTGEAKMAEYVAEFLRKLALDVEIREVEPGRPNVIGKFSSRGGRRSVALAPHTDTVSVAGMTIDPFAAEVRDGRLYGRGATDTKGSMAAMLVALAHAVRQKSFREGDFEVSKFIVGPSSSVYGINEKVPFSENDPIFKPISPYAATKLAGEALCHVYHHLYGIDIVCLRFFTVYGSRQRPDLVIYKFTRAIWEGHPIEIFGDGTAQRDYTYIDDTLQGVLASLDRRFGFEIINLGESRTVQLRELVHLIEKALGKSASMRQLPVQPGDVPITCADISKAQRLLGYNPQVRIEDGIAKFVEWFKNQV